ncbi:Hypothetical protein FKW44_008932, partial [Caligus rogercresseyi]
IKIRTFLRYSDQRSNIAISDSDTAIRKNSDQQAWKIRISTKNFKFIKSLRVIIRIILIIRTFISLECCLGTQRFYLEAIKNAQVVTEMQGCSG